MLLRVAREHGWVPMDLERWITAGGVQGRVLILRHDVDQHPATAVHMARIEAGHGLGGTWYFRWRTASPQAIRRVRELGGGVGLHYESLTRLLLERGVGADAVTDELIEYARAELAREVSAFRLRFGELQSICAHGDTRVPGASNQVLTRDVDPGRFGIDFDAGEALSRHRLGIWLTDRTSIEGGWKDGADPLALLRDSDDPILCVTHPNNWCSGASLWADRARAGAHRGSRQTNGAARAIRTGHDRPPSTHLFGRRTRTVVAAPELRTAPAVRPVGPIALSLQREILRHYYDEDGHLTSPAGVRTLQTNSALAESRVATLERILSQAQVPGVRGRDVLDLGCGFGALSLVFAAHGAHVTALDPNGPRLRVGARVAVEHALDVDWIVGRMDATDVGDACYDVAVMNNSFCYLVNRAERQEALRRTLLALRPGGVLVQRNPRRYRLRDQFTGIPLLGALPPKGADLISHWLALGRSRVRLVSGRAARRELRAAGFVDVATVPGSSHGVLLDALGAYQHLIARRPSA